MIIDVQLPVWTHAERLRRTVVTQLVVVESEVYCTKSIRMLRSCRQSTSRSAILRTRTRRRSKLMIKLNHTSRVRVCSLLWLFISFNFFSLLSICAPHLFASPSGSRRECELCGLRFSRWLRFLGVGVSRLFTLVHTHVRAFACNISHAPPHATQRAN